ncbi:SCO6880 family protein [Streptomyces sp. NPDC018833]|uniref:SCO6880 family protein n=1 Tax=Streptomyces sp. NPDC018833 TaxID=3365053 RepID=UPI0037901F26
MAASEISGPRTYGNWRKPTSPGIHGLGMAGTMGLLGGLVLVVLSMLISLWLAIFVAVGVGLSLLPLLLRDTHGRNGLQRATARLAFRNGRKAGKNVYRSGPLGRTASGTCQLPGLAAQSTLAEATDAHGRPFALLSVPSANHHTAVLQCDADGASLVDSDQVDTWVAYWGQWLAALAYEPNLVACSVTIEAAPDPGIRLEREVSGNIDPQAPPLAQAVLREVVQTYPAGSATLTTRVALTYSGAAQAGQKRRDAQAMGTELGLRLPGLASNLSMTGAGPATPMTASDLAEAVRVAYDPSVAVLVEEARGSGGSGITWDEAGPIAAEEAWGHYRHDGAFSITWSMSEAPRGEVFSSVLASLLLPHPDISRKRVTLLYRPHDPASAARVVERDRKDSLFKAQQAKMGNARDSIAVRAAEQAAREEATGAGVVRFGMLVTATVTERDELDRAAAAIGNISAPARVALRRVYGAQASAFAAALPLGLVLPHHLRVPQAVRDAM